MEVSQDTNRHTGGGTHMAFEDIAMMRTVPNAHIFDIVDGVQFNKLISKTVDMKGIYYYRTSLADNIAVYDEDTEFEIGKGIVLREGNDASIIALRASCDNFLQAAELLEEEGIHVRVVDMFTIKPLDEALVLKCAQETGSNCDSRKSFCLRWTWCSSCRIPW